MEMKIPNEVYASLGLQPTATAAEVTAAMTAQALTHNKTKLELEALKTETVKAEVTRQLNAALENKQITPELQTVLAVQYADKPGELKALIATMPSFVSVNSHLNPSEKGTAAIKPEAKALMELGWDKLDRTDQLKKLKAIDENAFLALYKSKFGYLPNEKPVPVNVQKDIAARQKSFPSGKMGGGVV